MVSGMSGGALTEMKPTLLFEYLLPEMGLSTTLPRRVKSGSMIRLSCMEPTDEDYSGSLLSFFVWSGLLLFWSLQGAISFLPGGCGSKMVNKKCGRSGGITGGDHGVDKYGEWHKTGCRISGGPTT